MVTCVTALLSIDHGSAKVFPFLATPYILLSYYFYMTLPDYLIVPIMKEFHFPALNLNEVNRG